MIDEIVNFIFENYPGVPFTKKQIKIFVERYRHRIVIARTKDGERLIGLLCYLKQAKEIHFIAAIRKKEFRLRDMFKIIRRITTMEKCDTIFIYSTKHKPKGYKLCPYKR